MGVDGHTTNILLRRQVFQRCVRRQVVQRCPRTRAGGRDGANVDASSSSCPGAGGRDGANVDVLHVLRYGRSKQAVQLDSEMRQAVQHCEVVEPLCG